MAINATNLNFQNFTRFKIKKSRPNYEFAIIRFLIPTLFMQQQNKTTTCILTFWPACIWTPFPSRFKYQGKICIICLSLVQTNIHLSQKPKQPLFFSRKFQKEIIKMLMIKKSNSFIFFISPSNYILGQLLQETNPF